jgi:hypothetical protein
MGPYDGEDEMLRERPSLRYLLGRLAPAGTAVTPEEDDGAADSEADDDDDAGESAPLFLAMNPSSVGLSCMVAAGVISVAVEAAWADYVPDEEAWTDETGKAHTRKVHKRVSHAEQVLIALTPTGEMQIRDLATGARLEWIAEALPDGRTSLSAFLVNRREARKASRPDDDEWMFQPVLTLRGDGGAGIFEARKLEDVGEHRDPELHAAELLYWLRPEYAVGHGCAAEWTARPQARERATEVRTELLPAYELPRITPREDVDVELGMRAFGGDGPDGVPAAQLAESLSPLIAEYGAWVDGLEAVLPSVEHALQDVARDHIDGCRAALDRMREGVELLQTDSQVREAFCFANRAMALQRERSVISLARRRGAPLPDASDVTARWRPFQLAFILLNLPSVVDRRHPDRRVVDLLWFPTGGGKTEAYLGLTAFVFAMRRRRAHAAGYRNDVGVSVLMRYTLRLLTIQQFQRATALVLACEHLRRAERYWGDEPFSIGLWVGHAATPNAYSSPGDQKGAKEALERIANGHRVREGSPIQLLSCPWCGAPLDHSNYRADDERERIYVTCSDDDCEFSPLRSEGMPVHLVDDDVYRSLPSLVIATVDKFARMPWNGRVQALFGYVARRCSRHGFISYGDPNHSNSHRETATAKAATVDPSDRVEPPGLIIQDELHLISGPLGTMVGTYEAAVDHLSSVELDGERLRPKVIASAATIRRAQQQVGALFERGLAIFPPQAFDAGDSWFGREVPTVEEPGRLYVGISAPGKSVKTALVRVYAALLSRARAHLDADAEAGDPYMTLVGYFNSLRELGGALRLVEDDVPGRMRVLSRRDRAYWPYRDLFEREELTSNKKAEEVPNVLAKLERRFTAERPESGAYPVDTLLASNMISVGVDIDRLGLMVVNGQPKTTAEYIQATSRVGRQTPGIVVTVYNWTRPRDLSHYERFRSYHSMLYRFVEATSVTPFSSRARDKALEGVLTSLVRLGDPLMTPEQAAGHFDPSDPWVREVIDALAARAELVSADADGSVELRTREEALDAIDRWVGAAGASELCYTRNGLDNKKKGVPATRRHLLGEAERSDHGAPFEVPGSLREVEGEIPVYLPRGAVNL